MVKGKGKGGNKQANKHGGRSGGKGKKEAGPPEEPSYPTVLLPKPVRLPVDALLKEWTSVPPPQVQNAAPAEGCSHGWTRSTAAPPAQTGASPLTEARARLPAAAAMERIVAGVQGNDITLITGGTGCGKSTQVPQFLLDQLECPGDILCTQPRRIAAIGVAERVAAERGEAVGGTVGYSIRFESKRSSKTKLLFCTTGVLLRQMQQSRLSKAQVSVIVVDEVHERSCESDMLLLLLREYMSAADAPKLVLMSATADVKGFQQYFKEFSMCVIGIEGRTFPVQRLFLGDALSHCGYTCLPGAWYTRQHAVSPTSMLLPGVHHYNSGAQEVTRLDVQRSNGTGEADQSSEEQLASLSGALSEGCTLGEQMRRQNLEDREQRRQNMEQNNAKGVGSLGGRAQAWIDRVGQDGMLGEASGSEVLDSLRVLDLGQIHRNTQLLVRLVQHCVGVSNGLAVLVFLPGLREISDLLAAIEEQQLPQCTVVPLHGELTAQQQRKVFSRVPEGTIKVVLATNIAETSITIDDVGIVIDTGTRRAMHYDPHTNTSALLLQRISDASAAQRAGRAGRVQEGVCYHLFLRYESESLMLKHDEPEILHVPLEASCLRLKALSGCCPSLGFIKSAFSKAITPPPPSALDQAMRKLAGLGMIQSSSVEPDAEPDAALWEQEELTPLGSLVQQLPTDPELGKLVLLGVAFESTKAAVVLAAALANSSPFTAPWGERGSLPEAKRALDPLSDHLAVLEAYNRWEALGDSAEGRRFLRNHHLSRSGLESIKRSVSQLLRQVKLLFHNAAADTHSQNQALTKALLVAAFYPRVASPTAGKQNVRRAEGPGELPAPVFKTVELWSGNPLRKPNGSLNDRLAQLHNVSALAGQTRLGRMLAKEEPGTLQAVYSSRHKTQISEVTIVSPMMMILFGGLQSTCQLRASSGTGNSHTLVLDEWIGYTMSQTSAEALLALREAIGLIAQKVLSCGQPSEAGSLESRTVRAVADLLLALDCTGSSGGPLPAGWAAREDVASSTGRVVYKNLITGHAQHERPTQPAEAPLAASSPKPKSISQKVHNSAPKPKSVPPVVQPKAAADGAKGCVDGQDRSKSNACVKGVQQAPKPVNSAPKPVDQATIPKPAAPGAAQNCSVSEAAAAALKLHQAAEAASERERKKNGVKHMTVAQLLEKTELTQFKDKFEQADFDDACLKQVIDELNEDREVGMELLEQLLSRAGVSGGAAARIRRQLQNKQAESKPQQTNRKVDNKSKGKGDAKSKEKKVEAAGDSKKKPKDEKTKCPGCGKRSIITKKNPCKNCKAF